MSPVWKFISTLSTLLPRASLLLNTKLLFGLMGLAFGGTLTFFNYAKLKRFAVPTFLTILGIVGLAIFFGPKYDGQPYIFLGPVRIKVMDACPFLFVVALAGMVARKKWDAPKEAIRLLSASVLVQTLFFFANSLPSLAMFVVAMTAIMHFSSAKYWQTCLIGLVGVALMLLLHSSTAYVTPETFSSVQTAESHTDYVVSYPMGSMGKWAGMVAIIAALLLTVQPGNSPSCHLPRNNYRVSK
jgi:cell division protein FtsW (lipid II flippase)